MVAEEAGHHRGRRRPRGRAPLLQERRACQVVRRWRITWTRWRITWTRWKVQLATTHGKGLEPKAFLGRGDGNYWRGYAPLSTAALLWARAQRPPEIVTTEKSQIREHRRLASPAWGCQADPRCSGYQTACVQSKGDIFPSNVGNMCMINARKRQRRGREGHGGTPPASR
jgi:hypothetical protein